VKALAGQTAKATEDIGAQISGMQHATARSIEAIGAIERTIRNIGEITGAIAAAVTEQGAATQEIARSVETAAVRTSETAQEVVRVGEATAKTRESAMSVKMVADDLGAVAGRIRGQVDHPRRRPAGRGALPRCRFRQQDSSSGAPGCEIPSQRDKPPPGSRLRCLCGRRPHGFLVGASAHRSGRAAAQRLIGHRLLPQ
jgi:hypothetical protein